MNKLPDGWTASALSDLVDKDRPIVYGIVQTGEHIEDGIPCVRGTDLTNGKLDPNAMVRTSEEISQQYKRTILKTGDLMFVLRGDIGLVALVPPHLEGANLTRGIALIAPNTSVDGEYLAYAICSYSVREDIFRRLNGSTFKEIPLASLRKVRVPLPPLHEQRKIAQILSTWDEAIALVEALIAALTERKKGLMQRLLTGEVRFPGFHDEWEETRLNRVLDIQYGKSPSLIRDDNGKYRIWGTSGVVGYTNEVLCDVPAVIIGRKGTIDNPYLAKEPFWAIDTTFYGIPQNGIDVRWIYYVLDHKELSRFNESSGVPSLLRSTLNTIKIVVPRVNEQATIADIIEVCDKEMALFATKRDYLREQKKGLMQRLLTGEVRVQVEE